MTTQPSWRTLANEMSEISELAYFAGWVDGLEYELWGIVQGGPRRYGQIQLTDDQVGRLRDLSETLRGWVRFDDESEFEEFIEHERWLSVYADWLHRRRTRGLEVTDDFRDGSRQDRRRRLAGGSILRMGRRSWTVFGRGMTMLSRKNRSTPYCCPGLGNLINGAGEAGLSALAWDNGSEIVLRLQARGIAHSQEHVVADEPDPRDRIWRVSMSTGLTFCPFCGAKVRRLVRASPEHFRKLAESHHRYTDESTERPVLGGSRG